MAVFWVAASCSLLEVYRRSRGACCFHHQGDKNIGKLLPGYTTKHTRRNHIHTRRLENQKLHSSEFNSLRDMTDIDVFVDAGSGGRNDNGDDDEG
jgi:hypothetical protein